MGLHRPVFPFNISCNFNHYFHWSFRPQHSHAPLFTISIAITCAFNHDSRWILLPQHFCAHPFTIFIEITCAFNHFPVQFYVCSISVHLYSPFPLQSRAPLTTIPVEYCFCSIPAQINARFLLKSRAPLITIPIQNYGLCGLRSADSILRAPFCGFRSADSAADSTEFLYIFNHYSHWISHGIASYTSIEYRSCEWHTNIYYTRIEIGFQKSLQHRILVHLSSLFPRGGGMGSRPIKMYGERLGDGVEYHLMSPTPRC